MTIEDLFKMYEKSETGDSTFAGNVYQYMRGSDPKTFELSESEFTSKYGMYLPEFDTTKIELGERERDIDYKEARNILDTSIDATNRVYATEMDTLGSGYSTEMNKARSMAGRGGIRTGTLDEALEDSYEKTANKAKNLGERLDIAQDEASDKYNIAMVDSALTYDKTVADEKEEFYKRTMAAIDRLGDIGAWKEMELHGDCASQGLHRCGNGNCVEDREDCQESHWGGTGFVNLEDIAGQTTLIQDLENMDKCVEQGGNYNALTKECENPVTNPDYEETWIDTQCNKVYNYLGQEECQTPEGDWCANC